MAYLALYPIAVGLMLVVALASAGLAGTAPARTLFETRFAIDGRGPI